MKRKIFSFLTVFISFLVMIGGAKADQLMDDIIAARSSGVNLNSIASGAKINEAIPAKYKFSFAKNVKTPEYPEGSTILPPGQTTPGQGWREPHNDYGSDATDHSIWDVDNYDLRNPTRASNSDNNQIKNKYYTLYKNIDVYEDNGTARVVSVKATLEDYFALESGDRTQRGENYYLPSAPLISYAHSAIGVYTAGIRWVKIKYEFFDAETNEPVSIKGNTSYWDIDGNQGIIMADNSNVDLYATSKTKLKLSTVGGKKYVFDVSACAANQDQNPQCGVSKCCFNNDDDAEEFGFGETFDTSLNAAGSKNALTRIYQADIIDDGFDDGTLHWMSNIRIIHSATAPVPVPPKKPVKSVNKSDITQIVKANDTYKYTVKQEIPEAIPANYYQSFKLTDTLKNILEPKTITVYKDSTSSDPIAWFDTNINGQTVTAELDNSSGSKLRSADFYGHTYYFVITAKVKDNWRSLDLSEYDKGIVYEVPNKATVKIDDNPALETDPVKVHWFKETPDPEKYVGNSYPATSKNLDITAKVQAKAAYVYDVKQELPQTSTGYYYSNFKFEDTLEPVLAAPTTSSLTIYQEGNTEPVTSWFNITTDGQEITATLKDAYLNNVNSYGKTYHFVIASKVKEGLSENALKNYRNGTVYTVPNTGKVTLNGQEKNTKAVTVNWYRGMCPGGDCSNDPDGPEPNFPPTKTVSTEFTNDTTSFDYRVSQYVPGYNAEYLWTELTLTDVIDKAFDIDKTKVKVISSRYGENRDFSKGDGKLFDVTIDKNTHTIKATAIASALTNENFYGPKAEGTTYTMVITTQVKEGFEFTTDYCPITAACTADGSCQNPDNCNIYKIIPNKADRLFKDKHSIEYKGRTDNVTTHYIDPKIPSKAVDTEMIRYEKEFKYTITHDVQPAGYMKSIIENGEERTVPGSQEENELVYYDSYVFTDVLEAPLQIKDASKVKITSGNENWTDKFNITVNGNTITATLKNPKDPNFYGTREAHDVEKVKTYKYELTVSLRDQADKIMDMSKYVPASGDRYVIPNKATIKTKIPGNPEVSKDTNNVNVYYYPERDPKKDVNQENITTIYKNGQSFTYEIKKDILSYADDLKYDSFAFEDVFEDCLEVSKDKVTIKNELNINVTSWFDVTQSGNTITATLKDPSSNGFYGHTYSFIVDAKVKQNYDLTKYKQGNMYIIPNEATFIIDNKVRLKTNKKEVFIGMEDTTVKVPSTGAGIPLHVLITGLFLILSAGGSFGYMKYKKLI